MSFIQLDGISLAYGEREILRNVNLTISPGTRIALVGANGSGKSTLMKIAAGIVETDSGRIIKPEGTRVSYLPQSGIIHKGNTVLQEALKAFDKLKKLKNEAESIAGELEQNTNNKNTEKLLLRYQHIQETLENAEWDRRKTKAVRVLKGLGFKEEDLYRDSSVFSGGWQMRMALSSILLESPDILLLDEPTNYLDIEAREWLADFLNKFSGGILLVSHDRAFLDRLCTQTAELFLSKLTVYKEKYSSYEISRAKELEELVKKWKRQQEEIEKIETFIRRFRSKASKASSVQSRIKMLEKIERIEIPPSLKNVKIKFPPAPHSGKITLITENLGKKYGEKEVFSSIDFELARGTRTAVTGINGAGKTTFLKITAGIDRNYTGNIKYGSNVKTGYFSQDQENVLDPSLTVLEEAAKGSEESEERIRTLLGAFLFTGEDIYKKVSVLSGGEKNRLALLKLLLEPVNFLILDEPTNHLDIHTKDILMNALKDFGGSLLIVSHDRYFLENTVDMVLEIENAKATVYHGDYKYYRWKKDHSDSENPEKSEIKKENKDSFAKISREEQKKRRSYINKLRKKEEEISSELEKLEKEYGTVKNDLEKQENYSDPAKAAKLSGMLSELESRIQQKNAEWEKAAEELEKAESAEN